MDMNSGVEMAWGTGRVLGGGGQRGKNWDNYDSTINFYLGSVVDSCEFVAILLFIVLILFFSDKSL